VTRFFLRKEGKEILPSRSRICRNPLLPCKYLSMRGFSINRKTQASKQADDGFLIPSNVFYDKSNNFAACTVLHISSREANQHRVCAISILSIITPLPQIIYPCNPHHLSSNPLPLPLPHLNPQNPCPHLKQHSQWT
jgi:hypothetical protein